MNKKWTINLIGVLIVLVVILMFWGQLGCKNERIIVTPEIGTQVPTIKLEATTISLSIDNNIECEEKCPGYEYPKDTGVIRIDNIISIDNPYNWDLDEIKAGNEITINFDYSARPAKIKMVPAFALETHVPTFAKPIPKEDGYFVYVIESTLVNEEAETILPGLNIGSKFSAIISYSSPTRISVGKYKIIP